MRYTEFRDLIDAAIRTNPEGMTWRDLQDSLNLPYKRPCPEWVSALERDIGLIRKKKRGNAFLWQHRMFVE